MSWRCHWTTSVSRPANTRRAPHTDLDSYGMLPTVQWEGETLIESFAGMTYIAETIAMDRGELGLVVEGGEPERPAYLQCCALFGGDLREQAGGVCLSRGGRLPLAACHC